MGIMSTLTLIIEKSNCSQIKSNADFREQNLLSIRGHQMLYATRESDDVYEECLHMVFTPS